MKGWDAKYQGLLLCLALLLAAPVSLFAASATGTVDLGGVNNAGSTVISVLKTFSTSPAGEALFFASLITGIISILFKKHRGFGLIALCFGLLLGAFGPIGDTLWSLFSSVGGGTTTTP